MNLATGNKALKSIMDLETMASGSDRCISQGVTHFCRKGNDEKDYNYNNDDI